MVILLLLGSFLIACLIIFLFFALGKFIEIVTTLIYNNFEEEKAFFVEAILFLTFFIFVLSLIIWKAI